ncbi:hypothetical protein L0665_08310 [Methanogenium marinum]|uniref:Uncharacterized protein n=1 Tax=Methanogenium marinum TaxID=348610 RepID=A0A9Q4PXG5_9EURY|nr:hypothetical protein [Methanogenium marinum]MDE4908606.1 hypothetical protein [Methanogenium marinum]
MLYLYADAKDYFRGTPIFSRKIYVAATVVIEESEGEEEGEIFRIFSPSDICWFFTGT